MIVVAVDDDIDVHVLVVALYEDQNLFVGALDTADMACKVAGQYLVGDCMTQMMLIGKNLAELAEKLGCVQTDRTARRSCLYSHHERSLYFGDYGKVPDEFWAVPDFDIEDHMRICPYHFRNCDCNFCCRFDIGLFGKNLGRERDHRDSLRLHIYHFLFSDVVGHEIVS